MEIMSKKMISNDSMMTSVEHKKGGDRHHVDGILITSVKEQAPSVKNLMKHAGLDSMRIFAI